jgi:hypothetical protein
LIMKPFIEVRSFGQGIMIADQIPTKLAPDCLKNTNLKIVHRTVMKDDRETIGHSMNMTTEQIEYLSVLKMGCAAVYSEGDTRPKLVKVPLVNKTMQLTRQELIQRSREMMQAVYQEDKSIYRMSPACSFCREQCQHFEAVQGWFGEGKIGKDAALIITFFCQRHALYKVCDFYKHQDLGLLFGRNDICANDFYDDCLARALDRLEESEFHELYGLILVNVRKVYQFHPDNFGISEELKVQAWA